MFAAPVGRALSCGGKRRLSGGGGGKLLMGMKTGVCPEHRWPEADLFSDLAGIFILLQPPVLAGPLAQPVRASDS